MTGNYAITDSDLDSELLLNEELITADIDCTNHRQVRLDFNMNYRAYDEDGDHEQIAEVDIRTSDDGLTWSDWTNLLRWDRVTVADVESGSQQVDLSTIADGKHIQIRFHFYDAEYHYSFAVDDIAVSGIQPSIPPRITGATLVGGQLTLTWDPEGSYYIEHTDDLTGTWTELPGGPVTGTSANVTILAADRTGYYRLRPAE